MEERVATAPPKPEFAAHERVTRLAGFPQVVTELVQHLGHPIVTELAGVTEARAVRQWAAGDRAPRSRALDERLRLALQIVYMLEPHDSDGVIRAWFTGLNPHLEDCAPVDVLREGRSEEEGRQVLGAAKSFIVTG